MVVVFHYLYRGQQDSWVPFQVTPWVAGVAKFGDLGVQLFFVISGFVIFLSARGSSPRAFVASRMARLYPAYWVAIPITTLVVWLGPLPDLVVSWRDALINFSMLTHWFDAEFVDGAYWSLAAELHFYILVWVALRLNLLKYTPVFVVCWLLVSLVHWFKPIYFLEFWLCAQWAPYFCIGISAYLVKVHGAKFGLVVLYLFAVLLGLMVVYKRVSGFVGFDRWDVWVSVVVVSVFSVVFWLIAIGGLNMRGNAFVSWAGALTYPVYLLHEYCGYVGLTVLAGFGLSPVLSMLAVIFGVVLVAYCVHVSVEKRFAPVLRKVVAGG